ncbi:MAG: transcriptional regulator, partial [Bacilli bacterium]|nr:transcriptional regulator [Bacilli bacterium]
TFACLRHFNGLETTTPILRERLGVEDRNAAMVSRILKECVDAGDLKGAESAKDKRSLNYVPFYA